MSDWTDALPDEQRQEAERAARLGIYRTAGVPLLAALGAAGYEVTPVQRAELEALTAKRRSGKMEKEDWLATRRARMLEIIRLAAALYEEHGLAPMLALRTAEEHIGFGAEDLRHGVEWWLMEIGLRNFAPAREGLAGTDQAPPRRWEEKHDG